MFVPLPRDRSRADALGRASAPIELGRLTAETRAVAAQVVLDRMVFVGVALHALAGRGIGAEGAAEVAEALERGGVGGLVGAPLVVFGVEPAGWLGGDGGFVASTTARSMAGSYSNRYLSKHSAAVSPERSTKCPDSRQRPFTARARAWRLGL